MRTGQQIQKKTTKNGAVGYLAKGVPVGKRHKIVSSGDENENGVPFITDVGFLFVWGELDLSTTRGQ